MTDPALFSRLDAIIELLKEDAADRAERKAMLARAGVLMDVLESKLGPTVQISAKAVQMLVAEAMAKGTK